jgi:DNA-binding MarR family transcriptional regulator
VREAATDRTGPDETAPDGTDETARHESARRGTTEAAQDEAAQHETARRDEVDALVPIWEGQGLPSDLVTTLELGKRVSRVGWLLEQAVKVELAELGLTYAEFEVLAALLRTGEPYRLRPSELTRSAFLTSGGTSNVLQRLEKAGYVERGSDDGDGRGRWVRLTGEGVRKTRSALAASSRAHREVMTGVPEGTLRDAADALREILLVIGRRRYR